MDDPGSLQEADKVIGLDFGGKKLLRDVDRLLGGVPALDKAIQKRIPSVLSEVGGVMVGKGRSLVPKSSGELAGSIEYQLRGADTMIFGVWGSDYAYPVEYGINRRYEIEAHERTMSVIFGKKVDPVEVSVSGHIRGRVSPKKPYLHPSFYGSLTAAYGIFNRAIEESKEEVGLGDS